MLVLVRTRSKLEGSELRRCGAEVKHVGRGYAVLDIPLPEDEVHRLVRKYLWHLASRMRKECGKRAVFRREFVVFER